MNFGININDFIGEVNLDLSNDANVQAQFEAFANQFIKDTLESLLNDKLYNDLIADLSNGLPVTQKYIDLVNGKTYTRPSGEIRNYEGLKRMLIYFIYDSWLDLNWSQNVSTGQINNANENSDKINRAELRKVRSRIHNKAVQLYNKTIIFINDNYENYFDLTRSDYGFWTPTLKKHIGVIITGTPHNEYYMNK